eukprot:PhM_4_TR16759/c0_g1_i1/m.26598
MGLLHVGRGVGERHDDRGDDDGRLPRQPRRGAVGGRDSVVVRVHSVVRLPLPVPHVRNPHPADGVAQRAVDHHRRHQHDADADCQHTRVLHAERERCRRHVRMHHHVHHTRRHHDVHHMHAVARAGRRHIPRRGACAPVRLCRDVHQPRVAPHVHVPADIHIDQSRRGLSRRWAPRDADRQGLRHRGLAHKGDHRRRAVRRCDQHVHKRGVCHVGARHRRRKADQRDGERPPCARERCRERAHVVHAVRVLGSPDPRDQRRVARTRQHRRRHRHHHHRLAPRPRRHDRHRRRHVHRVHVAENADDGRRWLEALLHDGRAQRDEEGRGAHPDGERRRAAGGRGVRVRGPVEPLDDVGQHAAARAGRQCRDPGGPDRGARLLAAALPPHHRDGRAACGRWHRHPLPVHVHHDQLRALHRGHARQAVHEEHAHHAVRRPPDARDPRARRQGDRAAPRCAGHARHPSPAHVDEAVQDGRRGRAVDAAEHARGLEGRGAHRGDVVGLRHGAR